MRLPDPSLPWPIPLAAVALIAEREQGPRGGPALRAYKCPAGVWTIGWGRTRNVTPGMTCTAEEADRWLLEELSERALQVAALCTEHAEPNELGAMVSLQYNIGADAFSKSTVLKCHNRGDKQAAARAFGLWNKARVDGVLTVLAGLTSRRAAEAALYLTPEPDAAVERMPQAVEDESRLAASPVMQGGGATVAAGAALALPDVAETLPQLKGIVEQARELLTAVLGPQPSWVLPLVLLAAGGAVMYWRHRQRREGWA